MFLVRNNGNGSALEHFSHGPEAPTGDVRHQPAASDQRLRGEDVGGAFMLRLEKSTSLGCF